MGQVLHGCAITTEAVRRAIQNSQKSLKTLAKRYGINPKTVAKWKKRGSTADLPTGPQKPKSTSLSLEDEAIIVAFRKHKTLKGLTPYEYICKASLKEPERFTLNPLQQMTRLNIYPIKTSLDELPLIESLPAKAV